MVTKKEIKDQFKELKELTKLKKDTKKQILSTCKSTIDKETNEIEKKMSKILGNQLNNVVDYPFSDEAQKIFTEFADSNDSESFVVLDPFHDDKNKKYKGGAISGGQFWIEKTGNRWKIIKDNYINGLHIDNPSLCELADSKDYPKCQKALTNDFKLLQYIDKLSKKNPVEFKMLLEY